MAKYLSLDGLSKVKQDIDAKYVAKDGNKVLSDNNFTDALKNKLDAIASGAQVNVIETIKVNGTALTPDANKAVSITVPDTSAFITKDVNDLTYYYTKTQVDGIISAVYKPAGTVAFASLPTLSASVLGNVYNVSDAFTTTSDFVEGSGKSYPAGTNVVVVDTSATSTPSYKFDVLAGMVDLSGYVPTTRKVNNKALSSDITLSASDVGALPSNTTYVESVKSIDTTATTAQSTSSSEAISGTGTITLHKVAKTGTYSDLISAPANETASSGGSTVSLVTTGEKYTWNNKQNAITGGASSITSSNLTASKALVSDSNGKVAVSSVTSTELGYLSGVTSSIQTQLGNKQDTMTEISDAEIDEIFEIELQLSNEDNT